MGGTALYHVSNYTSVGALQQLHLCLAFAAFFMACLFLHSTHTLPASLSDASWVKAGTAAVIAV